MPKVEETAVIFEGGAFRAVATAPVVEKLIALGIEFPYAAGISAGATHTANYISKDAGRSRASFINLAADKRAGSWQSFLQGRGLFDSEYIYHHTSAPGELLPFDYPALENSSQDYRILAFRIADGQTVAWGREDVHSKEDFLVRVQASSSMPGLMPFTAVDGEFYADGGIGATGGIAIDAAEADGYENFFVVMTRSRDYVKTSNPVSDHLMRTLFRNAPKVAEAIVERPERYNRTREHLFELERQGRAYLYFPEHALPANRERDPEKLTIAYEAAQAQVEAEYPRWLRFLELD
ncbi:patatin-like phospholipase family protein [Actinobaculum suis]|uniref:patatin-like phospholipase family protein n=1 Tax=Actinobaculum suis TaxID=1657 RepID=UPI000808698C|nr:patatin family protein [Actinobaculum suis]OCA95728.1 patatin family protein [Actinobaculum suis]OCA95948.1 patatin family protein [Actinobaculum suis]